MTTAMPRKVKWTQRFNELRVDNFTTAEAAELLERSRGYLPDAERAGCLPACGQFWEIGRLWFPKERLTSFVHSAEFIQWKGISRAELAGEYKHLRSIIGKEQAIARLSYVYGVKATAVEKAISAHADVAPTYVEASA